MIMNTDEIKLRMLLKADMQIDMPGANLRFADLYRADLCGADLRGAYLCGADLREAYLYRADLRGADLRGAYLCVADLCSADLREANLCGADLHGADLCGAILPTNYQNEANAMGDYPYFNRMRTLAIDEMQRTGLHTLAIAANREWDRWEEYDLSNIPPDAKQIRRLVEMVNRTLR